MYLLIHAVPWWDWYLYHLRFGGRPSSWWLWLPHLLLHLFIPKWSNSHSNTENWSKLCYLLLFNVDYLHYCAFFFFFPNTKQKLLSIPFFKKVCICVIMWRKSILCNPAVALIVRPHLLQKNITLLVNISYLLDCGGLSRH